jgi:capsular polysaccharide biosynthesis protein
MAASADNQAVAFSEKVFERLLAAYPKVYRQEYGGPMAQLFRDQCRDAWSESRGWGLARLWLRVLPDVVGTSLLEHLDTIKERKFMLNRIAALFRSVQSFKFLTVFTAVFLLVVIIATVATFTMPEVFASTSIVLTRRYPEQSIASIKKAPASSTGAIDPYLMQTECYVIQSEAVLGKVVEQLKRKEKWGEKLPNGERATTSKSIDQLRRLIQPRLMRDASIIEIKYYSDRPSEAAALANTTAEAYAEYRRETMESLMHCKTNISGLVIFSDAEMAGVVYDTQILNIAMPNPIPVRPNKPLNITLGVLVGIMLGSMAGGGVAGISFLVRRNSPPKIAS